MANTLPIRFFLGTGPQSRAQLLTDSTGATEAAGRLVKNYSGGMRRRLDISASIVVAESSGAMAGFVTVDRVSGNLFETVGAAPLLGRVIRPDEDTPGAPRVLVLSHRFWRARFGGDALRGGPSQAHGPGDVGVGGAGAPAGCDGGEGAAARL